MQRGATQETHLLIGRHRASGLPAWLQGLLVSLLIALCFGVVIASVYHLSRQALINEIHAGLSRTSKIALLRINPEVHKTLTRPEQHGTPEYDQEASALRNIIRAEPLVAFTWTAIVSPDDKVYFILDGTLPPDPGKPWSDLSVKVMEEYPNAPREVVEVFRSGEALFTEPYTDEWGTFISSFAPMRDRNGKIIAVLAIDLRVTDFEARLKPVQQAALIAGAIGAAAAVIMGLGVFGMRKRDRREAELNRQLRITNALLAVARAFASKVSVDDLAPVILKQTGQVMGSEASALFLYDASRDQLRAHLSSGGAQHPPAFLRPGGIIERALRSKQTQIVTGASKDPEFDPATDSAGATRPVDTLIAAPILDSQGKALGVLAAVNKGGDAAFDADDKILIEALGGQVFAAIDRARLTAVFIEKQKLDEALKLAASIQMSMLSRSFPPPSGAVELHAAIVPAKQVGGDFYDFFWLSDKQLGLLVADVSGKGMPAALFMAKAKTLIKAHSSAQAPADILARANDELCIDNDAGMFVTVFLGVLDVERGELRYANAGHNHPYLLREGQALRVPTPNDCALGVMEGLSYEERSLQLTPADALFLYTDGVNEAMDPDNQQFDYPRLEASLQQPFTSVAEVNDRVLAEVNRFASGAEPSDDITVLGVRWVPTPTGT